MKLPPIAEMAALVKSIPKVELHLHLDGAMRPSTLYDLAIQKGGGRNIACHKCLFKHVAELSIACVV